MAETSYYIEGGQSKFRGDKPLAEQSIKGPFLKNEKSNSNHSTINGLDILFIKNSVLLVKSSRKQKSDKTN